MVVVSLSTNSKPRTHCCCYSSLTPHAGGGGGGDDPFFFSFPISGRNLARALSRHIFGSSSSQKSSLPHASNIKRSHIFLSKPVGIMISSQLMLALTRRTPPVRTTAARCLSSSSSLYPHYEIRQTRWNDNDEFGHINGKRGVLQHYGRCQQHAAPKSRH